MRHSTSALLAALLLFLPSARAQAPGGKPESIAARVDKLFAKWDNYNSPGCALGVYRDGRIVYARGYGMADLDHNARIEPSTVFHVASMSKQFTAASIVLLALEGKLSLDDPARKYIPELPDFGAPITIRELVHHISGLRDQWALLDLAGWRYSLDLITNDDVLSVVSRQKDLNFPPGSRYMYSNTGYTLLGEIVKRVSGESLRAFTTHHIFEPLGMTSTHFRDDHAELVKGMAIGYEPVGETFKISITNFDTVGATSLLTTVEDLQRWDENFYNPRVGGPAMTKQMLERRKLNDGEVLKYAFGLEIDTFRGLTTVDHGGADAGYRSDMIRFPDQHFTVACLCNAATSGPGGLARQVAAIYLEKEMTPEAAQPEVKPVTLTEEQFKSKAGLYLTDDGDELRRIVFKDGKLQVTAGESGPTRPMTPLAEDRFRLESEPVEFTFRKRPDGRPEMTVVQSEHKPVVYLEVPPFAPSATELAEYAGTYHSPEIDALYRLRVEAGKLMLDRIRNKPAKLAPATLDLFAGDEGSIRFVRDSAGHVAGFVLNTGRIRNFKFEKGSCRPDTLNHE
jgi:CubicO group peptidase (beta-lactamase class C family)